MTNEKKADIKYRLSDIGEQVGKLALEYITELEKENEQLKVQVEQLSNDNYVLKTSFITQNEQIEKMKRCFNCVKWFSNTELCVSNERGTSICDKWELTE